jgi:hypothetical protein
MEGFIEIGRRNFDAVGTVGGRGVDSFCGWLGGKWKRCGGGKPSLIGLEDLVPFMTARDTRVCESMS